MDVLINIVKITLEEGLMYALLAFGVYLTYSILDFPDLSVDGTMPLGAIVTGVMILRGANPWLCLLVSFFAGAAAGCATGFLHVKLKIRPLLSGILVYTALLSVNLVILFTLNDGNSVASFFRKPTIFSAFPASLIPETVGGFYIRQLAIGLVLVVVCKLLLDLFLRTKCGLLLRATGDNAGFVSMLARDPGQSKVTGLAIGNGFAALAGSVIAQAKGSADQQMGTGMVVLGLASVIIGLSLFRGARRIKPTLAVVFGSIAYKACLSAALALGLPTEYLKLLMAVLFIAALFAGDRSFFKRRMNHAA